MIFFFLINSVLPSYGNVRKYFLTIFYFITNQFCLLDVLDELSKMAIKKSIAWIKFIKSSKAKLCYINYRVNSPKMFFFFFLICFDHIKNSGAHQHRYFCVYFFFLVVVWVLFVGSESSIVLTCFWWFCFGAFLFFDIDSNTLTG